VKVVFILVKKIVGERNSKLNCSFVVYFLEYFTLPFVEMYV